MKDKVKELKEFIQKSADLGQWYKLSSGDITMMEVLDYINELESENERLKLENKVLIEKAVAENIQANNKIKTDIGIIPRLQSRIAEFENKMKNRELIELPCICKTKNTVRGIRYEVVFFNDYYNTIDCYVFKTRELAEQKLKELKGERK